MNRHASGRPRSGEFADYAQADIDAVAGEDIVTTLAAQIKDTLAILRSAGESAASEVRYAPGKWNLKQVAGHLADDERIFAYRALCIARRDSRPLPGFDERDYVNAASFESMPFEQLLENLRIVRASSISLFKGVSPEAWLRTGWVNGYTAGVRGLAFHIAGHELHHMRIVREKYLPLILA
jgi:hypothetical protein